MCRDDLLNSPGENGCAERGRGDMKYELNTITKEKYRMKWVGQGKRRIWG